MQRRAFIRLVGGSSMGLASCSSELPHRAIEAWQGPPADEPDARRWALAHAVLAPHSHNLQSWVVDLRRPGEILLSCDLERTLPQTDPLGRQIVVSHGTFLELLDIAARERGYRPEFQLFPQGVFAPERLDARPLALVRLHPDAAVARDPLFAHIRRRHTNREAYLTRPPEPAALQAIAQACSAPGLRCGFAVGDAALLARHRRIASTAWRIELTTPRTLLESYRWLRIGPEQIERHRDGIALNAPLLRVLDAVGLFDRRRAPGPDDWATRSQIEEFERKIQATPAFFWLASEGNARETQVAAGRAYVRAQLAATAHGLAMQPLSQALQEYPEQATAYREIHELVQAPRPARTVQMWTRLGYAPPVAPAPRRGLQSHILAA